MAAADFYRINFKTNAPGKTRSIRVGDADLTLNVGAIVTRLNGIINSDILNLPDAPIIGLNKVDKVTETRQMLVGA